MNTVQEFNGWTNRETWAVALHINNDEGLLSPIMEVAQLHDSVGDLADEIEGFINEVLDFDNISTNRNAFIMLQDIGSLYRVNWYELASSFKDESIESEKVSA
jgi:hypothetical protein